jgi:hypothetical protein
MKRTTKKRKTLATLKHQAVSPAKAAKIRGGGNIMKTKHDTAKNSISN